MGIIDEGTTTLTLREIRERIRERGRKLTCVRKTREERRKNCWEGVREK